MRELIRGRLAGAEVRAFAVGFVLSGLAALVIGAKAFPPFDAASYWDAPKAFLDHGDFSLLHYRSPLRGYAPGLLYGALRLVAEAFDANATGSTVVGLFNAFLFALTGAVLAPRLARAIWPAQELGFWRRLGLVVLLLVFWHGYLSYPLSDFPALVAALAALVFAARGSSLPALVASGVATGLAVDTRPAYLVLMPIVLVLVAMTLQSEAERPSAGRSAAALVLLVAGMALVLVPQSLITHRQYKLWSPIPGAAANLTSFQLTTGLQLQRYETYVGGVGRPPRMSYLDPHTHAVVEDLGRDGRVGGYLEYLGLIGRHPLTMAGVFARHVVNGIDQRYPTPYVERLDTGGQRPLRLASWTLIFGALLRLLWPVARRGLGRARRRYAVALVLTCAAALPSAVETRFLLPGFVFAAVLVLEPGWPRLSRPGSWVTPAAIALSYVAFMVGVALVTEAATAQLRLG